MFNNEEFSKATVHQHQSGTPTYTEESQVQVKSQGFKNIHEDFELKVKESNEFHDII